MKLVQLLAKELNEWPERVVVYFQWGNGEVFATSKGVPTEYSGGIWYVVGRDIEMAYDAPMYDKRFDLADDHDTATVNKSQWQAEREKMNKPKWIRHRGGKCPVAGDVKVLYRMRSGTITSRGEPSCNLSWDHSKSGADIMAYRVIEETKDQEIEEVKVADVKLEMMQGDSWVTIGSVSSDFWASVFDDGQPEKGEEVKKTNFGTITYNIEIDATGANKELDSLVAKWGQIESPLKWRDAIIHCQAIIEDCEREIERNVNLLDAEGLMMKKDSKKAMQSYAPDVDMSDWRNWENGDIIEVIKESETSNAKAGLYTITGFDSDHPKIELDERYFPEYANMKFVRRP